MLGLLPQELLREICNLCDYSTNFSLRWVCRAMIGLVKLPPKGDVVIYQPRFILVRELITAIATCDGNYNLVKWLRGLGYSRSPEGSVLVGSHCGQEVSNYYCASNDNCHQHAIIGRVYTSSITKLTHPVSNKIQLSLLQAALMGGNIKFIRHRKDKMIHELVQTCITHDYIDGIDIINDVQPNMSFRCDQVHKMSIEMYRHVMTICPDNKSININHCQTDVDLMEQSRAIILRHIQWNISVDINLFRYCPLLLWDGISPGKDVLQNIVKSIDPRVHRYYKSQIITDRRLLLACNRISWIRKYFMSAAPCNYTINIMVKNNSEVIQWLSDNGIV